MRLLLDACVLYPTVMREMLIGAARAGFYNPRWSPRILGEWAHAAARLGPEGAEVAQAEIAILEAAFPAGSVQNGVQAERGLWLPDADDVHVLAAAVAGSCDGIVTVNAKDFPRNILGDEGLFRSDPDGLLCRFLDEDPDRLRPVAQAVLDQANRLAPAPFTIRSLMKKARLPRLGKRLSDA